MVHTFEDFYKRIGTKLMKTTLFIQYLNLLMSIALVICPIYGFIKISKLKPIDEDVWRTNLTYYLLIFFGFFVYCICVVYETLLILFLEPVKKIWKISSFIAYIIFATLLVVYYLCGNVYGYTKKDKVYGLLDFDDDKRAAYELEVCNY